MQDIATAHENTEGMYTQTKHGEQTTGGNDQRGNQTTCDRIRKVASKRGGFGVPQVNRDKIKVDINFVYQRFICGIHAKLDF